MNNNRKRSGLKIMYELMRLLGKLKYFILPAALGGILGNACAIAVMVLGACSVAKLIDPDFMSTSLGVLVILTIGCGVLRGLLRYVEQYNNHYIAFKLLARLRDIIFGKLRVLAPAKLEDKQKGSIISMLTADVETLEVFYAHTISPVLITLFVDGVVTTLIWRIGTYKLGIPALLAYILIGVVIPFASNRLLEQDGVRYRRQFADSSSYFLDSIKGITDILMLGEESERGNALGAQSNSMNKNTIAIKRKNTLVGAVSTLMVSAGILVSLALGTHEVTSGNLSVGNLVVALVLLSSSFGPVLSLSSLPGNLTQTFASGDRILDFLEEKPVVVENKEGKDFSYSCASMQKVSFSYGKDLVLQDVSLDLPSKGIVGIIGKSGCGKSTLLKLLLRFYDVEEGRIAYNNIDIKEIKTDALHENVVMVSQDTFLFQDTIYNNLILANPKAGMEEVKKACRMASIDEFISSLPDGYNTEVGLCGDSLSTGEKQRIGLARAFLSGARLLLLDEVTSNVDAINEGIILKSLKNAAQDRAIVIVSHRESTIQICDSVYRIENGILRRT